MGLFVKSVEENLSNGDFYWRGNEHQKAAKYYEKAAKQGSLKAIMMIAWMYENGDGVTRDYKKAIEWYSIGVSNGDINAMLNLANMYQAGRGTPVNYERANELFEKAANGGSLMAAANLGRNIYSGYGRERSLDEGAKWIFWAADNGYVHYEKMVDLGLQFEEDGNKEKAGQCFRKALGEKAKESLDECFDAAFSFLNTSHYHSGFVVREHLFSVYNAVSIKSQNGFVLLQFSFTRDFLGSQYIGSTNDQYENLKQIFNDKHSVSNQGEITDRPSFSAFITDESLEYLGRKSIPVIKQYIVDYEASHPELKFSQKMSDGFPEYNYMAKWE